MANKLKTYTRNGSLASIWSESGSSGPPSPATDVVFPHLGLSIKTDPSSVPLLQESPIDEELEKNLFPRNQSEFENLHLDTLEHWKISLNRRPDGIELAPISHSTHDNNIECKPQQSKLKLYILQHPLLWRTTSLLVVYNLTTAILPLHATVSRLLISCFIHLSIELFFAFAYTLRTSSTTRLVLCLHLAWKLYLFGLFIPCLITTISIVSHSCFSSTFRIDSSTLTQSTTSQDNKMTSYPSRLYNLLLSITHLIVRACIAAAMFATSCTIHLLCDERNETLALFILSIFLFTLSHKCSLIEKALLGPRTKSVVRSLVGVAVGLVSFGVWCIAACSWLLVCGDLNAKDVAMFALRWFSL